jgi:hypothetical protein
MFMWGVVAVVVAAVLISLISSVSRRAGGLMELGAVSNQWLAEHRQYQEGDRSR